MYQHIILWKILPHVNIQNNIFFCQNDQLSNQLFNVLKCYSYSTYWNVGPISSIICFTDFELMIYATFISCTRRLKFKYKMVQYMDIPYNAFLICYNLIILMQKGKGTDRYMFIMSIIWISMVKVHFTSFSPWLAGANAHAAVYPTLDLDTRYLDTRWTKAEWKEFAWHFSKWHTSTIASSRNRLTDLQISSNALPTQPYAIMWQWCGCANYLQSTMESLSRRDSTWQI